MANRLALELVADGNPLLKTLDNVQRNLDRFMASAETAGHAIGGTLGKSLDNFMNLSKGGGAAAGVLAGGFAAVAAGAVALTAAAGRQIESLDMLSQKTGIALNTLQNWSVIMAENDFQAESLTGAMRTLSKQIVEARDPSSKAAAAFKEMGLAATDLGSTESVIRAVADRFVTMADGPDKARIAVELFGKSGLDLIPILNRGSKALDESKEASEKFAAVLRSNQVEALKAADDAMDRVGVAANALKSQLGAVFAPTVEWAARMFADALGVLARWARDLDTALDTLAIRITHIGLAGKELGAVLFSKDVLNSDAWKQALDNITLIDQEAAKLIAKRRELAEPMPVLNIPEIRVTADLSAGQRQEELGRRIIAQSIEKYKLLVAEGHAQEALGRSVNILAQQESEARNKAFGLLVAEQDRVAALNEEYRKYPTSGPFVKMIEEREEAVRNLTNLMPELTREQAIAMAAEQTAQGTALVQENISAWEHRNDVLEMAVEHAKVLDEAQQVLYQSEQGLIGASDIAREKRMALIEAEGDLQRRIIEESIASEEEKASKILQLEIQLDTRRRQAIQQYPSFFESQMQAIVQSNSFSVAMIANTWTSGLANAVVNGGNFMEQAWKSTQVALLQGILNFGIQKMALLAGQASQELAIWLMLQSTKLATQTATDAAIVGSNAASAGATAGIWEGAAAAITGTFGALTGAITGFFTETILPFFAAIGEALMTFLSSISAAASATVFGIPYGVAILAGVAIIGAAIGSLMAFAFADGGIATGPTMGLVGEAGSSEAVIPLNKRGAAFMRDAMGGTKSGGPTSITVELDGRQIAKSVFDSMPSVMRMRGISV